MSSPDRAPAKRAAAKKPDAPSAAKSRKTPGQDTAPSAQDKADFLKAMSKGIEPNTEAARKVASKKKTGAAEAGQTPKVEVLRKIAAPAAIENTPESVEALRLAAMIEEALAGGELEKLQPHAQQALVAALCKYYAANSDQGNRYPVLGQRSAVTATDVMVMCGALLKAVDLQVFELGMWQSWSNS